MTHALLAQLAAAFANEQAVPHAPQLLTLVAVSTSQPSIDWRLQSRRVPMHELTWQLPLTHSAPPVHEVPQVPQCAASDRVFTSQPLAALASQSAKPALHSPSPQVAAVHVAAALGYAHAVAQLPQWLGLLRKSDSQPSVALALQSPKFALHAYPHAVPSQLAEALAGTVHVVQLVPHVATAAFDTHAPEQSWKPALHATPQLVPLQVAVPLGGTVHAEHAAPQLATLAFDTHAPAQSWKPALHVKPQAVPLQVAVAFAGGEHGTQDEVPHVDVLASLTH